MSGGVPPSVEAVTVCGGGGADRARLLHEIGRGGRERLVYRICSHASASASPSESSILSLGDNIRTKHCLTSKIFNQNVVLKIQLFSGEVCLWSHIPASGSRPKQRSGSTRRERRKSFEWVIKYADRAPPAATLHLHSWYS